MRHAGRRVLSPLPPSQGPLWWTSHHRHHHRTADTVDDAHRCASACPHDVWLFPRACLRVHTSSPAPLLLLGCILCDGCLHSRRSPVQHGFFWSHMGWFMCTDRHTHVLWGALRCLRVAVGPFAAKRGPAVRSFTIGWLPAGTIPDLAALPELQWLERYYLLPPVSLAVGLFWGLGARAFLYGFAVSTVLCWHATYAINSVAHLRYCPCCPPSKL